MSEVNRRIVLAERPQGRPGPRNFRLEEAPVPEPGAGEVLCRTIYLSLDPYMRGRMSAAKSYAAPLEIGDVMLGGTVCEVVESRAADVPVGTMVLSFSGWQTHSVVPANAVRRLDPSAVPVSTALGVLGMPGFTAYAGLLEIEYDGLGAALVVFVGYDGLAEPLQRRDAGRDLLDFRAVPVR